MAGLSMFVLIAGRFRPGEDTASPGHSSGERHYQNRPNTLSSRV